MCHLSFSFFHHSMDQCCKVKLPRLFLPKKSMMLICLRNGQHTRLQIWPSEFKFNGFLIKKLLDKNESKQADSRVGLIYIFEPNYHFLLKQLHSTYIVLNKEALMYSNCTVATATWTSSIYHVDSVWLNVTIHKNSFKQSEWPSLR